MLQEALEARDEKLVREELEKLAHATLEPGAVRAALAFAKKRSSELAARWISGLSLERAADPDEALVHALRALESCEGELSPALLERTTLLCGLGGAPANALAAHPEDLARLGDLALGPLAPGPPGGDLPALRAARRRHSLAVAGAELAGALSNRDAALALSDAADALLDATLVAVRSEVAGRHPDAATLPLAVLALGKLGGRELNYSSDVDLVLLRGDDVRAEPAEALARAFVRALEENDHEGRLYRVDLRLRPEGSTGALAPRVSGALDYYAKSGRTWERQAFLKARAAAGDRALGAAFLEKLEPFLFGTSLSGAAIEEILSLRARIEAKAGAANVKEGPGGIRDVEYCVQFLQLLHGADAQVRATGTLDAIERLEARNIIHQGEARTLRESYGFLRRIEHALQLTRDRELKHVPTDPKARTRIARALGLDLGTFDERLERELLLARGTLDALLRRPFAGAPPAPERPGTASHAVRDLVLGTGHSPLSPATDVGGHETFRSLGFRDPAGVARALESLASERNPYLAPSGRARTLLAGLAPRLLGALGRAPDPDGALRNLERATATLGAKATFYELLLENPDALELFCALAAASDFLVETLARRPGVFDEVVDRLLTGDRPTREKVTAEARAALLREDPFEALRDVRAVNLLLVGIRDLSGRANAQNTGRDLAALAEGVLEVLIEKARSEVASRGGGAPPVAFAVLAVGKLGGYELSYSSDLDLLFVIESAGSDAFYEEVARQALRLGEGPASPDGPLYPIDLRLRPAGGQGPLAWTLEAARRYYAGEGPGVHAEDWERLALQKLRPVAGDRDFADRAARVLADAIHGRPYPGVRSTVRQMREKQVEAAGADDLKRAPGGLADVEFLASALALEHGLRETNTARLLRALEEAGSLSPRDHLELMTAYQFLRRVELRLRVALARAESKVSPGERRALALRLGYVDAATPAEEQLGRELDYERSRIRAIFDKVMG